MNSEDILRLDGLSMRFGGLSALSDVSFSLPRGAVSGLIGPNGAGKTTLFNCLSGLHKPSSGRIIWLGGEAPLEAGGLRPERMTALGLARTFQNIRLFGSQSVLDNVRIGRHCRGASGFFGAMLRSPGMRAEEREFTVKALELLDFVGLSDKAGQNSLALSYGEQRKLEIARALASEPKLLLLDEPAAGMNPRETEDLIGLIRAISERKISVLLIEHDMRLVMRVCERLAVLDHGVLIAVGSPGEIRRDPAVIEAYLGRGAACA